MNCLQLHKTLVFKFFILAFTLILSVKVYAQNTVTIDGYVYEDLNRGFLNRVKLTLLQSDGVFVADTLSEMDGHFVFNKIPIGKKYDLQFEKKVFVTAIENFSTEGKTPNEKIFIKKPMKRLPGYFLEVTLAEKRLSENTPVDAITGARFEVYNNTTRKEEIVIDSTTSNQVNVVLQQGNEYILMLRKKGYYTKRMEARVNVKGCYLCMEGFGTVNPGVVSNISSAENNNFGTLIANMDLERIDFKRNVVMQNILFEPASSTLRESSFRELDKVVSLLKNNPSLRVELGAHTDSRGSAISNMKLSLGRAQSAVDYILNVSKGSISQERIVAKGYGESQLLNKCEDGVACSEDEHAKNRRIELKVFNYKPLILEDKSLLEMVHQEEMDKFLNGAEGDIQVHGSIPTDTTHTQTNNSGMMIPKILEKNESNMPKLEYPVLKTKSVIKSDSTLKSNNKVIVTPKSTHTEPPEIENKNVMAALENSNTESQNFSLTIKPIFDYSGYKIEFLRTVDLLSDTDNKLKFIAQNFASEVAVHKLHDNKYSYLVGNLSTWGEAERLLDKLKTQYPTAHIVDYYKGKRLGD